MLWPKLIEAAASKIRRIRCIYTNDAENDTIINDDEKFQGFNLVSPLWV